MNRASMVFLLAAAVLLSLLFVLSKEVDEPPVVASLKPIDANPVAVATSQGVVFEQYDPSAVNVRYDEFESAIPHAVGKNYIPANRPLKSETVRVELGLDESLEYKVEMNGGDSVVYQWKVLRPEQSQMFRIDLDERKRRSLGKTHMPFHGRLDLQIPLCLRFQV